MERVNNIFTVDTVIEEGTWIPDEHSCMNTIDNINDAIKLIENENIL